MAVKIIGGRNYGEIYRNPPHFYCHNMYQFKVTNIVEVSKVGRVDSLLVTPGRQVGHLTDYVLVYTLFLRPHVIVAEEYHFALKHVC